MGSSDSKADEVGDTEAEDEGRSGEVPEFLGAGPEKALEKNSSAEEAVSPE
jgi:hypothetical protein